MAGETISLDELRGRQERLRCTIEVIEPDRVKITPFVPGVGCLCPFAITLPAESIESIVTTDEYCYCCGEKRNVVEVSFTDPVLMDVLRQVAKNAGRTAGTRAGSPQEDPLGPTPRNFWCDLERRECRSRCNRMYRPGTYQHRMCMSNCDEAYHECEFPSL